MYPAVENAVITHNILFALGSDNYKYTFFYGSECARDEICNSYSTVPSIWSESEGCRAGGCLRSQL